MTARVLWLLVVFILGAATNTPGAAQLGYDLGRATRVLLGLGE